MAIISFGLDYLENYFDIVHKMRKEAEHALSPVEEILAALFTRGLCQMIVIFNFFEQKGA